jgi:hypothetical protein
MNGENKKKNQEHYQKNRDYFLGYYQENKSRRKYNFCVVCGRNNENNKYIKVCSRPCSLTLRRSTMQGAVRDFYKRKEEKIEKLKLI